MVRKTVIKTNWGFKHNEEDKQLPKSRLSQKKSRMSKRCKIVIVITKCL